MVNIKNNVNKFQIKLDVMRNLKNIKKYHTLRKVTKCSAVVQYGLALMAGDSIANDTSYGFSEFFPVFVWLLPCLSLVSYLKQR